MFILALRKIRIIYFLPFLLLITQNLLAESELTPLEYTLKPGDLIDITVEGYPEYSKQIAVRVDGMISYPVIGTVRAEGRTTSELEKEITKELSAKLGTLKVYVILIQSKQNSVYVLGSVKMPGRYFFETEKFYLLQALSMAEGLDAEKAELKHIQIRRDGAIKEVVDFNELINDRERKDIILEPNDLVFVPNRLKQSPIHVTGAVLKQGTFYVESESIHILEALRLSGGPEQDVADLRNAVIISNGVMNKVNIEEIERQANNNEEIVYMNPGDILHIPNAYEEEKISVIGDVQKPGQYFVKRPINIIEALSLGGGWKNDTANLKEALIIKKNGNREEINLLKMIENRESAEEVILYPGDTLQIPQKFQINWSALLTVTSVISLLYNIFR